MLTAWDIEGEVIVEAFTGYYGEPPALDRIIWRNVVDPNTQLQLVERGEADIAYSLDPDAAQNVGENDSLQLITGPTLAHEYLALNLREDIGGPLANQQVRQAIGYAIDYDGIIETLLAGAGVKPATIVPLPLLGAEEVQGNGYTLDLTRAQELWDASGVGETEITFSYGAGGQGEGGVDLETLVAKLQSDLQQISGLTIALNPMDPATRLEEYRAGTLQFTISGWSPDYPDVHTYAEPFGRTDTAAAKRVGYSNPEVDQWLDDGIAEADPEARKDLYVMIQEQLISDAAFLVLYQPIDQKAASAAVQGLQTHSVLMMQLRNVTKSE
jgi:peptide/nickel transport system substrate-binding protein